MNAIRNIIFMMTLIVIISCNAKNVKEMNIEWEKMSTVGLGEGLEKGVSASYAALIDGKIIVAGGANFPGKLGFEGGTKALYDEIVMYNSETESWNVIGRLPEKSAYGVSIALSNEEAVWIGGNSDSSSLKSAYKVMFNDGSLSLEPFVSLPVAIDNFAGCAINNKLFVAGGVANGAPSNSAYMLILGVRNKWIQLPDFPGVARIQPVMSAVEIDGKEYVYLLGGFFGGDKDNAPAMLIDILRFDVQANEWEKVGEQLDSGTNQLFSLGGATAVAWDNRYIICFGGVNHDVFLDAITTQYNISNNDTLSAEEKGEKNLEFSKHYMTQPIEYYNFNKECRVFDTHKGAWSTIDNTSNAARAGATIVYDGNEVVLVQGELKPGVRSADTWKVKIAVE